MDFASIVGLFVGFTLVLFGISLQGSLVAYASATGVLIVLGGTMGGIILAYSFTHLRDAIVALKIIFSEQENEANEVISTLVSFAEKARREGLLALEDEARQLDDEFLRKGIQLVVDGTDPELVRSILETELDFMEERHSITWGVYDKAGELSPAFGMIGTLIGLIAMLGRLDDPSSVGPGMATALITTFYGTLSSNLMFVPMAEKLKVKSEEEILVKEVMIEGILSIQAGENPRIVEEKLKAFLSSDTREEIEEGEAVGMNAAQ